jgi:hypothetical protein
LVKTREAKATVFVSCKTGVDAKLCATCVAHGCATDLAHGVAQDVLRNVAQHMRQHVLFQYWAAYVAQPYARTLAQCSATHVAHMLRKSSCAMLNNTCAACVVMEAGSMEA